MKYLKKYEVEIFSSTVLIISSLIVLTSYLLENKNLSILCVFIPSLVALILSGNIYGKKGIKELFVLQTIKKISLKWVLFSLFFLPALVIIVNLFYHDFQIAKIELRSTQLLPQVIVIVLIAVGEEYGWRGFLLPRLIKKYNLFVASIIVGFIWGIWHFPASLIGTAVPLEMSFLIFMCWVILGSILISWVYFYTQSVLTSIMLHISANATFNYLYVLPEFTGDINIFYWFLCLLFAFTILIFLKDKDLFLQNSLKVS